MDDNEMGLKRLENIQREYSNAAPKKRSMVLLEI
jgi:hypothetical protein